MAISRGNVSLRAANADLDRPLDEGLAQKYLNPRQGDIWRTATPTSLAAAKGTIINMVQISTAWPKPRVNYATIRDEYNSPAFSSYDLENNDGNSSLHTRYLIGVEARPGVESVATMGRFYGYLPTDGSATKFRLRITFDDTDVAYGVRNHWECVGFSSGFQSGSSYMYRYQISGGGIGAVFDETLNINPSYPYLLVSLQADQTGSASPRMGFARYRGIRVDLA